ncbi:MAG: DNA-binding response regulator [Flavobacteriales bacterium]|nr:DNA-binding response regulator [Flavobacteriales bacterium]|tara:strand:+ start:7290 stop:7991 length:702 start_codon:yes stop_codon:yes gene_type:complete
MEKRILLVEDEEHLIDVIKLNLELENYIVKVAEDGKKAIELWEGQRFDLILIDVMLPNVDGLTVCETIRLKDSEIPILILSAKGSSTDRILGLKAGADDYLLKPFNLEELLLRIQILIKKGDKLRQNRPETSEDFSFGNNYVNFSTYEFKGINNQQGQLTAREIQLIKLLVERKNEVVSRDTILELIWGVDVYPSTRTIDNYLLNFRKYFEKDPKSPVYFHSVRGIGYKFVIN